MLGTADERGLLSLVDHCLRFAKADRLRPLPIVLLWGPRASGKSELLDHIQERFYADRPYVRRNRHELAALRPHEVALQLAFHLGWRVEGFGRLRFPRLLLGVAAIRGPVNTDDPAMTRSMMIRRTISNRKRLRKWVHDTAVALAGVAGAGPGTQVFLGLAVDGVGAIVETALARSGRGMRWYQDGLGVHFADPVDALVRLADQEANPHLRGTVDEVLCRAFLADLRDEYSKRRPLQIYDRDESCLILLDDVDSAGAQTFLDVLATQRQEWDPLLIVAAASTRCPSAGDQHPEHWVMRDAAEATHRDWSNEQTANGQRAALCPVELGGLALDDLRVHFTSQASPPRGRDVFDVAGVLGDIDKALTFAHRLTEGHLGGMRLVLRTMSLKRQRAGAENVDVRGLFGWPVTADSDSSLAEEVRRLVVGEWSVEMHRALLRSTAARDFGEESLAAVLDGEPDSVAHMMRKFRSRDLWVRHSPGLDNASPPTLHPFPRRGVVHLLAEPSGRDQPNWNDMHGQLRDHADERRDPTSAMYHRLALGEGQDLFAHVSAHYESEKIPTPEWYAVLTAITQAPLAHPAQNADSQQHWLRLVENAGDRYKVSAELVTALQLHSDPLGDPGHHLCLVIAQELERLARASRAFFFVQEKAEGFRNCWERWHHDRTDHRRSFD